MRFFAIAVLSTLLLAQEPPVTFQSSSNLVVVNVVVRDRKGNILDSLKKDDFEIYENGKRQTLSVFEFQRLSSNALPPAAENVTVPSSPPLESTAPKRYRDKRLLVLFFDLAGMPVGEQIRTQDAALQFVREKLTDSDVVQIMSFGAQLRVDQEFTGYRQLLIEAIQKFRIGEGALPGVDPALADDGTDRTTNSIDDSELDLFNSDRKLAALESASRMLAPFPEKKALIYFSSGSGGSGVENQAQLRSTINVAVRSNVSFYAVDVRGLMAAPPGGSASTASPTGTGIYTGQTQTAQRDTFHSEQETLFALSAETGGKALLDNNDLTVGMVQAQKDLQSYYILGYYSTDDRKDGKFRKVEVKVPASLHAKVDYRPGYYGAKEWKAFGSSDKERQLQEALLLGDPQTDLPLTLEVDWFRLNPTKYFVPVAVKIPGSAVPLARKGSAETAEFDFIAQVRDSKNKIISAVRDSITIKLPTADAGAASKRSVLYDSGFTLPPGSYQLKLLARENGTGKMGTFETKFVIPASPSLSTVVWSSQREPLKAAVGSAEKLSKKSVENHPLIQEGFKLVPNVTKGFRTGQPMYVYAEAYDAPRVAASVSFFRGRQKVLESEAVRVDTPAKNRTGAVPVQIQIALQTLRPGRYTCQLNVIDEAGRRFTYQRTPIVITP